MQCERGWLREIINPTVIGCMDEIACNFDPDVNEPDDSCIYAEPGTCDCAGNILDECNICGGGGIPAGEQCCEGKVLDCTGQCSANPLEYDCAGVCGGNAVIDECGVCNGDGICYTSLKIISVKINSYYDGDGYYWDYTSYTDPYVQLQIESNTYQYTSYYQDFNYNLLPLTLNFNNAQFIYNFNSNLKLYLIDDDLSSDDMIGYTSTFTPNDILESSNINQYTIQGTNQTSFTIYIQWYD